MDVALLVLRRVWDRVMFPHAVLAGLALAALYAQMTYRVPSRFVFLMLPTVGAALAALSVLVILNRLPRVVHSPATTRLKLIAQASVGVTVLMLGGGLLLRAGSADSVLPSLVLSGLVAASVVGGIRLLGPVMVSLLDGPTGRMLLRLEQGATVLVGAFVLVGLLIFLNGALDRAGRITARSEVLRIEQAEVELDQVLTYAWADLRSWRGQGRVERVFLTARERSELWVGEGVVVTVRAGALGIPWVANISRDDEWHYRRVVQAVPRAAGPRKELIRLLHESRRWAEVAAATHEYARLYPKDSDYIRAMAFFLVVAGYDEDSFLLIEPFALQRLDANILNTAGWLLHRTAAHNRLVPKNSEPKTPAALRRQSARGIAMLEASLAMNPANAWTYYHLGYAYQDHARYAEASAMFQKALQKMPGNPDIQRRLLMVREPGYGRAAAFAEEILPEE
jgi:tetratricopeptide (TPR) repeat protein